MADRKLRGWSARCRYEGREPFMIGSFLLEHHLGYEDARRRAVAEATAMFERILPLNVPPPDEIIPIPGIVFFTPEEPDE